MGSETAWPIAYTFLLVMLLILIFVLVLIQLWQQIRAARRPAPGISILLLLQNQERIVEGLVWGLFAGIRRFLGGRPWELVVVDTGSEDSTVMILERLQRRIPGMKLVRLKSEKEDAVQIGLLLCDFAEVIRLDARHGTMDFIGKFEGNRPPLQEEKGNTLER